MVLFILVVGFSFKPVSGQDPNPLVPADTTSPSATLTSFINACNDFSDAIEKNVALDSIEFSSATERVLDCLDLSVFPKEVRRRGGIESAVYLKELIDRIQLPNVDDWPGKGDPLSKSDSLTWRIPGSRLSIRHKESGPFTGQYLFSAESVERAAKYYSSAKSIGYRTTDPKVSPKLLERFGELKRRLPDLYANTSSPRNTLTLFIETANEIYSIIASDEFVDRNNAKYRPLVARFVSCLDQSQLPEYSRDYYASEASVCLKEVLDRITLPSIEEIPGAEDVKEMDGEIPVLKWQIPNTQIFIARVNEGPRRGEYLFTSETVAKIPEIFQTMRKQPYQTEREISEGFYDWYLSAPSNQVMAKLVRSLPSWFRNRLGSLAYWQWIGLLISIAITVVVMVLCYRIGRHQSQRARQDSLWKYWAMMLFPMIGIIAPLLFMQAVDEYLTLRGTVFYVTTFCANLVLLLALLVVILGVSTRIADSIIALPSIEAKGLDAALTRILCRLLGIVVAVIVFLEGGRYLGFPLTTLLASAGIGGLAIALSAQGMIKGLFGTIMILLDKRFRVGERIVVRGHDGIVEEIGLRTTKIRLLQTSHLVSIPNDQMADSEIENIGRRKHIRRVLNLHLPLDTPRQKVELAVANIRQILDAHDGMTTEYPPRVYFNEFNSDSFNIYVTYWYHPPNPWDCMSFNEQINMKIFKAFEDLNIQFSLPSRFSFWKNDAKQGPLDVNLHGSENIQKE